MIIPRLTRLPTQFKRAFSGELTPYTLLGMRYRIHPAKSLDLLSYHTVLVCHGAALTVQSPLPQEHAAHTSCTVYVWSENEERSGCVVGTAVAPLPATSGTSAVHVCDVAVLSAAVRAGRTLADVQTWVSCTVCLSTSTGLALTRQSIVVDTKIHTQEAECCNDYICGAKSKFATLKLINDQFYPPAK